MLRIDHLEVVVQPPLSFAVPEGECLAVEGPSGSGKTRLLRAIADLDPAKGYVFLDGAERREMRPEQWRRQVRYVAAEPGWWAATAAEQMPVTARTARLVRTLGLEDRHLSEPLAKLSTGERLRLALIRALSDEPKALLLDEPTASLDQASAALVEELIRFECLAGRSVILVSHDAGQIERLAHARLLLGRTRTPTGTPGDGPLVRNTT
ncbi:MAG: ATP-binding cassette domain-containing protein [Hyphomicrobiaceae bacterium]